MAAAIEGSDSCIASARYTTARLTDPTQSRFLQPSEATGHPRIIYERGLDLHKYRSHLRDGKALQRQGSAVVPNYPNNPPRAGTAFTRSYPVICCFPHSPRHFEQQLQPHWLTHDINDMIHMQCQAKVLTYNCKS